MGGMIALPLLHHRYQGNICVSWLLRPLIGNEPGLGEQRDHRLGEMPLPVHPAQPLIGAKRLRYGPGPSHSVDSPTAAPLKRVRVSEIEIQTYRTVIQTTSS